MGALFSTEDKGTSPSRISNDKLVKFGFTSRQTGARVSWIEQSDGPNLPVASPQSKAAASLEIPENELNSASQSVPTTLNEFQDGFSRMSASMRALSDEQPASNLGTPLFRQSSESVSGGSQPESPTAGKTPTEGASTQFDDSLPRTMSPSRSFIQGGFGQLAEGGRSPTNWALAASITSAEAPGSPERTPERTPERSGSPAFTQQRPKAAAGIQSLRYKGKGLRTTRRADGSWS